MDSDTCSPTSNGTKRVNQTISYEIKKLIIHTIAEKTSQLWLKCLKLSQQLLEQFI
jgi:hypothetical protein